MRTIEKPDVWAGPIGIVSEYTGWAWVLVIL